VSIGPMHEEKIMGSTPKVPLVSFSFSLLKVGIPLVKRGGIPTFKNETKTRQVIFLGCVPGFLLHA